MDRQSSCPFIPPAAAVLHAPASAAVVFKVACGLACLQDIVPEGEWQEFLDVLKKPLPITFRINGSGRFANELRQKLESDFFSHFSEGPVMVSSGTATSAAAQECRAVHESATEVLLVCCSCMAGWCSCHMHELSAFVVDWT
jgi:hypothetical protein